MSWRLTRKLMLGTALAAATLLAACQDEPLPELTHLPDFTLTAQTGDTFRGRDLDGKVWIADFIFTSCPTYCPLLTERLKDVREDLAEHEGDVRYLSVSVDPKHDTPEVLREYARQHGIEGDDWRFVTGETSRVSEVVVKGFKTPMGERVPQGDVYDILHARHFVLVDQNRTIRGYYRTEPEELDRLVHDAKRLLE